MRRLVEDFVNDETKGIEMAELKCKDGTIIEISDKTEIELRKAFGPKPNYKDSALRVYINEGVTWPITIRIAKDCVGAAEDKITRTVKGIEAFILALQEAIDYCKQHDLGL